MTPQPSTLTLSTTTLNFVSPPSSPAAQSVTMSTNGAPISFTVTSGATWLTVATLKGVGQPDVVTAGEEYPLTISVNSTSLAPQVTPYVGKITVVASGAAVTVKSRTITVNLTANSSAPTISSVWPSTVPVNGAAQNITIYGTNFYSATVAKVVGVATDLVTTPDKESSTFLTAVIPASLLTAPTTLKVLVSNPAPGGDSLTTVNVLVANTAAISAVVNAASYASGTATAPDIGTVSPGELVTIFATNLAPTTPELMSITAGFVDTTATNGVTVTVDGKPAPLIYVSATQISVQVPYEISMGAHKVVSGHANPPAAAVTATVAERPYGSRPVHSRWLRIWPGSRSELRRGHPVEYAQVRHQPGQDRRHRDPLSMTGEGMFTIRSRHVAGRRLRYGFRDYARPGRYARSESAADRLDRRSRRQRRSGLCRPGGRLDNRRSANQRGSPGRKRHRNSSAGWRDHRR